MAKKGQAAMEFLMTYGWAILVVLAAIGALAYFGVLSPDRFLPSKCVINPPLSCTEFKLDAANDRLEVGIQNNAGVSLNSVTITLGAPEGACSFMDYSADGSADSDAANVTFTSQANGAKINGANLYWICEDGADATVDLTGGEKFSAQWSISYQKSGESVTHTTTGSIQTKAES